jgi:acyl-CoA synthetase (AMP-forming)/AMP-acid ligase II/acyl carrier protein
VCAGHSVQARGNLKLVAVSQSAALYRTFALPPKTEHRWLGTFPLDGITGQNCALVPYGSWTQIGADTFAANPLSVLDAIQELRVTGLTLTPSAARRVIAAPAHSGRTWDLGSLRQLGLGGETVAYVLAENLARFLSAHGASPSVIRAGYGTTETGYLVQGANPIASPQVDAPSLGACAPGASLRVVGTDGKILAEGEIGELQVSRPQTMFSSYWGDPAATRQCFTDDGWWRTGDLGRLQDGELSLHGRAKEIFVVSGKKISLASIDAEIEGVLGDQERVFSCAVHWPGEVSERLAVVFVPADPNPSRSAEIADLILRTVARRFGVRPSPVIAATLDDVPLSGGGKIRRSELARRVQSSELLTWRDASPRSNFVEPRQTEPIEPRLAQIWRDALNITGDLDRNASFFDLGGDSPRSVMLHEAVEQQFGKQISPEDFFAEPTFSTLLKLVASGGELTASGTAEATVPWPLPADLRASFCAPLRCGTAIVRHATSWSPA